jgi:hypothetical protein
MSGNLGAEKACARLTGPVRAVGQPASSCAHQAAVPQVRRWSQASDLPQCPAPHDAHGCHASARVSGTHLLKTSGYLISTVSVMLLGFVSWKNASTQPILAACLIGGMLTSLAGMACRWLSYEIEERRKGDRL